MLSLNTSMGQFSDHGEILKNIRSRLIVVLVSLSQSSKVENNIKPVLLRRKQDQDN